MQTKSIFDRFDDFELGSVVEILARINPKAEVTRDDIMTTVAVTCDDEEKPSCISTGGWIAHNYRTHDGTIRWRVSLTPYTVERYLAGE